MKWACPECNRIRETKDKVLLCICPGCQVEMEVVDD